MEQLGGCLCGAVRYRVTAAPLWVTVCFCQFCQRATGSQGMIEPIFEIGSFDVSDGKARVYTHVSSGSGKNVYVHFCGDCGTKTHLTFERWPDRLGVYSGTFDDPSWFEMSPANTKYIFLDSAARGTMVPAGYNTFARHAAENDGTPITPSVLSEMLHMR
ncbi:GFA family protein [Seohaeicola saemankumensis]|nr:GFA family protein [Seohaeicola saemankumensis]